MRLQRRHLPLFSAVALAALLQAPTLAKQDVAPTGNRIALVIGNSRYEQLGTLRNADSDARAVDEAFRKLGYKTQLVVDATGDRVRRELRQFAGSSASADLAVVFYAGHGAQVGGSNYLLPVDMEVPRFESDLSLDGIKIDDIVNTLRSRTKVVFLDACRDNPSLFKNLAKGRGTGNPGLAPANSSGFDSNATGGGIFIAYAADAGSVAADGIGSHSPFTEAVLRHLGKPISIDDFFSLVTREVRLTTNNAQRPYKYASLEGIVCLTGTCSVGPVVTADVATGILRTESEDFDLAMRTRSLVALRTFLDKYPDGVHRVEAIREASKLRRSQYEEWTLIGDDISGFSVYVQFASIGSRGNRAWLRTRSNAKRLSAPPELGTVPNDAYREDQLTFDCGRPLSSVMSESTISTKSGQRLWYYKWGDPALIDFTDAYPLISDSLESRLKHMACGFDPTVLQTPLLDKADFTDATRAILSSLPDQNGEHIFFPDRWVWFASPQGKRDWTEAVVLQRGRNERDVKKLMGLGSKIEGPLNYTHTVTLLLFACKTPRVSIGKIEYVDRNLNLIAQAYSWPIYPADWLTITPGSTYRLLEQLVCPQGGDVARGNVRPEGRRP